jgi:uncharacterized protein (DUF1778 family)
MSDDQRAIRRSERINLRVEPEADVLLRAAARAQHKSLSAFIIDASVQRAQQVLDAERRLVLHAREFARVLDELDKPAQVVVPLLEAAERLGPDATQS